MANVFRYCGFLISTACAFCGLSFGLLQNVRVAVYDVVTVVVRTFRDWFASAASPVLVLRKISASLFGPEGALALYDRRRMARVAVDCY